MKTVLAIDSDRWACETYRANFPETEVRQARVENEIEKIPYADLITGGFPCQPHSLAGECKASKDERDGGPDFVAAIKRSRPRMFLGENVAGILSSEGQKYVRNLLLSMVNAGYAVEVKLLDSVNFGVPQFRERVWFWGIRQDLYDAGMRHAWPKPTHTWPPPTDGLFGSHGLLSGVTVGNALGISMELHKGRAASIVRRNHPHNEPAPAITNPENGSGRIIVIPYHWSPAMLAKHPPASPASTVQAKYAKGGAEGLLWVITDNPKHTPHTPANTLNSGGNGHGPTFANQHVKLSSEGRLWESHHPPATPATPATPAPTVRARSPRDGGRCTENIVREGIMARRLTVHECMKLMSAPDSFRWPEKISKTAQYRICGNGQASLMVHRLAEAMRAVDPEGKTHVSLFCGGGVGDVGLHGRFWEHTP